MKTLIFLLSTFCILENCFSQYDKGTTMAPILTDAVSYAQTIESTGSEIVRMEFDILKTEKETYRTLQDGWTYGIWAFGDYRISDIDIDVYKEDGESWTFIGKDSDIYNTAKLVVKPLWTGMYKIIVRAYKLKPGYPNGGHYGLIIFHE